MVHNHMLMRQRCYRGKSFGYSNSDTTAGGRIDMYFWSTRVSHERATRGGDIAYAEFSWTPHTQWAATTILKLDRL